MDELWPYIKNEITKVYFSEDQYEKIVKKQKIKYALHTSISCDLQYFRYLNTIPCDKEKFPDAKQDDCLINPDDYCRIVDYLVKDKESKQIVF